MHFLQSLLEFQIFVINVRKYLAWNNVIVPICHVKAVQDDISSNTIGFWLHDSVDSDLGFSPKLHIGFAKFRSVSRISRNFGKISKLLSMKIRKLTIFKGTVYEFSNFAKFRKVSVRSVSRNFGQFRKRRNSYFFFVILGI